MFECILFDDNNSELRFSVFLKMRIKVFCVSENGNSYVKYIALILTKFCSYD